MNRIDESSLPAGSKLVERDATRGNEQAWRQAMDGALFDLLQRDERQANGTSVATVQARPHQAGRPTQGAAASYTAGAPQARARLSTELALAARHGSGREGNLHPTMAGSAALPPAFSGTRAMSGPAGAFALDSVSAGATEGGLSPLQLAARPEPRDGPPIGPVTIVQPVRTSTSVAAPSVAVPTGAPAADELPPVASTAPPDTPGTVPADRHVFLERTRDGAVIWVRDAQADPQTLARGVRSLVDEAHRRGVRVAGVRWNGQPVAADLNHFRPEHQQGEDRGR